MSCTSYTNIKILEFGVDYSMFQLVKFGGALFALQN